MPSYSIWGIDLFISTGILIEEDTISQDTGITLFMRAAPRHNQVYIQRSDYMYIGGLQVKAPPRNKPIILRKPKICFKSATKFNGKHCVIQALCVLSKWRWFKPMISLRIKSDCHKTREGIIYRTAPESASSLRSIKPKGNGVQSKYGGS